MDQRLRNRNGETQAHARLKRLALVWAQREGYSACAMEVTLPHCRYRADLTAYRPNGRQPVVTAIFECKQALVDLRRDNGCTSTTMQRLEQVHRRREILERNLRVHYPALRVADSLFDEFDSHNFSAIDHRGYKQVVRQTQALQNRLFRSANRRWSIFDVTTDALRQRCSVSSKFTGDVRFWREICAFITQRCALPIHSSTNSIRTISPRSTTAVTNRLCGKRRHYKIDS